MYFYVNIFNIELIYLIYVIYTYFLSHKKWKIDYFVVLPNTLDLFEYFKDGLLFCLLTKSVELYCFNTKYKAEYNTMNFP